jgi:hypothetical protein
LPEPATDLHLVCAALLLLSFDLHQNLGGSAYFCTANRSIYEDAKTKDGADQSYKFNDNAESGMKTGR